MNKFDFKQKLDKIKVESDEKTILTYENEKTVDKLPSNQTQRKSGFFNSRAIFAYFSVITAILIVSTVFVVQGFLNSGNNDNFVDLDFAVTASVPGRIARAAIEYAKLDPASAESDASNSGEGGADAPASSINENSVLFLSGCKFGITTRKGDYLYELGNSLTVILATFEVEDETQNNQVLVISGELTFILFGSKNQFRFEQLKKKDPLSFITFNPSGLTLDIYTDSKYKSYSALSFAALKPGHLHFFGN